MAAIESLSSVAYYNWFATVASNMVTVDEDEMIIFRKQASDWWNPNGPAKGLHSISVVLVPRIKKLVIESGVCRGEYLNTPTPFQGLSILDAGCGAGITTEALSKLGCAVTGLDPCEEMIKVAKGHAALNPDLSNVNYVLSDVETFAEKNAAKFDVVVSCTVLEHVTKYEDYLEACIKCLKKGGSIFVITFNRTFLAWFGGIILAEYVLRFIRVGTHQWRKFIALEETKRVLKKYNCEAKSVIGLITNMLTNTCYCTRYKGVLYGVHSIKQ